MRIYILTHAVWLVYRSENMKLLKVIEFKCLPQQLFLKSLELRTMFTWTCFGVECLPHWKVNKVQAKDGIVVQAGFSLRLWIFIKHVDNGKHAISKLCQGGNSITQKIQIAVIWQTVFWQSKIYYWICSSSFYCTVLYLSSNPTVGKRNSDQSHVSMMEQNCTMWL